jgi:hypothetical protein
MLGALVEWNLACRYFIVCVELSIDPYSVSKLCIFNHLALLSMILGLLHYSRGIC